MANDNNDINTDELTAGSSSAAAAASGSSSSCSSTVARAGMANDNNDINTDELTAGSSSAAAAASGSSSSCSSTGKGPAAGTSSSVEANENTSEQPSVAPAPAEVPRREENPFSFKHFLKWDGPVSSGGAGGGSGTSSHNHHTSNGGATVGSSGGIANISTNGIINHSRSTSNINGHGTIANDVERMSVDALQVSGAGTDTSGFAIPASSTNATIGSSATGGTGSPSKSATTSSLHVVSSTTTGARPKIPQFQSVNTLSSESKMKRSPRFPSFDSQSSLSDFAADELRFPRPGGGGGGGVGGGSTSGSGIYTSRSNSSFCSGRLRDGDRIGDDSVTGVGGYVQRSYSHYDIDPDSPDRDGLVADGIGAVEDDDRVGGPAGRLVGASAEFSAALPDFVQDHLVMEQWYNTLPKGGGSRAPSGAGPVLAEFEHGLGEPVGRGDVQPALLNDMPFDLTGNIGGGAGGVSRLRATGTLPLDLDPATGNAGIDRTQRRITPTPSADLPPDLTEGGANGGILDPGNGIGGPYYYPGGQSPPLASAASAGTADKIHRLPDFLSDGPIHSSGRLADVTHDTPHGTGSSDERANHHRLQQQQQQQQHQQQQHQRELHYQNRLEMEQMVNERLRRELDSSRRTVGEQSRRIRELERDLETMVSLAGPQQAHHHHSLTTSGSSGSTQSNANSFMLAKSRAATAEAEVQRLKQKLAGMSAELETLRRENERLKECEGAIGGTGAGASALPRGSPNSPHQTSRFLRSQTLALRQAAASAENNLRQLLSGVENLRSMANEIESFNGTFSPGTQGEGSGARAGASISETYRHRAGDGGNNGDDGDDDDDDDDDDEGDDDALGPAL